MRTQASNLRPCIKPYSILTATRCATLPLNQQPHTKHTRRRLQFGFDINHCVFVVPAPGDERRPGLPRWLGARVRVLPARVVAEQLPGTPLYSAEQAYMLLRHGTQIGDQRFLPKQHSSAGLSAMVGALACWADPVCKVTPAAPAAADAAAASAAAAVHAAAEHAVRILEPTATLLAACTAAAGCCGWCT